MGDVVSITKNVRQSLLSVYGGDPVISEWLPDAPDEEVQMLADFIEQRHLDFQMSYDRIYRHLEKRLVKQAKKYGDELHTVAVLKKASDLVDGLAPLLGHRPTIEEATETAEQVTLATWLREQIDEWIQQRSSDKEE